MQYLIRILYYVDNLIPLPIIAIAIALFFLSDYWQKKNRNMFKNFRDWEERRIKLSPPQKRQYKFSSHTKFSYTDFLLDPHDVPERKQATEILQTVKKCADSVNHTADPEVYFSSLNQLIDGLMKLAEYEDFGFYNNSKPSKDLEKILLTENLDDNADRFITRYIYHCADEAYKIQSEIEIRDYCASCFSVLEESFLNANSYWPGLSGNPHYIGAMYSNNNLDRVEKLCQDKEAGFSTVHQIIEDRKAKEREEEISRITQQRAREAEEKAQRDYEMLLEQTALDYQNWVRKKRGLTPLEDELRKVDNMDGLTFETWCADLLQHTGYCNVQVTRSSGDHGVDIIAEMDGLKYAIQCKRQNHDCGNKPIQEVTAGRSYYRCNVGVVMTNQYFTEGAKELAEVNGILLWDRTILTELLKKEMLD